MEASVPEGVREAVRSQRDEECFPCPGLDVQVTRGGCETITSTPARNRASCAAHKCSCKWRLCWTCLTQGVRDRNAHVIDPNTGLCRFHTDQGVNANRRTPRRTAPPPPEPKAEVEVPAVALADLLILPTNLGRIVQVPIDRVRPFDGQPRTEFDPEDLQLLSLSLGDAGQLVPVLLVEVFDDPNHDYQIVDGERRLRACKSAGIQTIKGIVYEGLGIDDVRRLYATSAIANFGRSSHSQLERAKVAQRLMDEYSMTLEKVARTLGIKPATLLIDLRLLKLNPQVQALMSKELPEGQRLGVGPALLLIDYPSDFQLLAANTIITQEVKFQSVPRLIRRLAAEAGVTADRSRPGRRPSDDVTNTTRFLDRMAEGLDECLTLPDMTIEDMFRATRPTTRGEVVAVIDSLIARLTLIKEGIRQSGPVESA